MPLDKTTLKQAILNAFNAESDDPEINPAEARDRQAQAIADAIDSFVKGGKVSVNVSVDPSSHVGTGTGSIS